MYYNDVHAVLLYNFIVKFLSKVGCDDQAKLMGVLDKTEDRIIFSNKIKEEEEREEILATISAVKQKKTEYPDKGYAASTDAKGRSRAYYGFKSNFLFELCLEMHSVLSVTVLQMFSTMLDEELYGDKEVEVLKEELKESVKRCTETFGMDAGSLEAYYAALVV